MILRLLMQEVSHHVASVAPGRWCRWCRWLGVGVLVVDELVQNWCIVRVIHDGQVSHHVASVAPGRWCRWCRWLGVGVVVVHQLVYSQSEQVGSYLLIARVIAGSRCLLPHPSLLIPPPHSQPRALRHTTVLSNIMSL